MNILINLKKIKKIGLWKKILGLKKIKIEMLFE